MRFALILALAALSCTDKAAPQAPVPPGESARSAQPQQEPRSELTPRSTGTGTGNSAGSAADDDEASPRSAGGAGGLGVGNTAGSAGSAEGGAMTDAGKPGRDAGAVVEQRDGGTDAGSRDAGTPRPEQTAPTITCPATALTPGETRASLTHDGRMRGFLIYVPSGYDNSQPVPLVLNFHGATMTAEQQRDFSAMNATADAKGFVVVYPQGVGNSWNAGACCGEAQSSNVDDVGFARALLDNVREKACIDSQRIYSAGFSNGGRMSYRLGCEMADVFAAIAPVAGTKSFPDDRNTPGCKPARPISLIDFMGSADPRSEAQPGQIAEWVAFNGCMDASPTESYRQGAHFCSTYSQCNEATSVTFCMVDGGDHCWPGSYPCLLGNTSRPEELSANDLLWQLFEKSKR